VAAGELGGGAGSTVGTAALPAGRVHPGMHAKVAAAKTQLLGRAPMTFLRGVLIWLPVAPAT
jgi:hypothetical protein